MHHRMHRDQKDRCTHGIEPQRNRQGDQKPDPPADTWGKARGKAKDHPCDKHRAKLGHRGKGLGHGQHHRPTTGRSPTLAVFIRRQQLATGQQSVDAGPQPVTLGHKVCKQGFNLACR